MPISTIHTKKKKKKKEKKEYLNTTTLKLLFMYKLWKVTATKKRLLPSTANVFILTHRLGGVVVFWLIPGGSVCLIPAVAVYLLVIHATEMEGGQGESMVTSHLLQGDLFQVV